MARPVSEIWKDVLGYEGAYQVSSYGRVKSLGRSIPRTDGMEYITKEKILKQPVGGGGYGLVRFSKDGKWKTLRVHRLIAEAFIPNPEKKRCVNHKDGNKLNNHLDNLEWATYSENTTHAYKTGLMSAAGRNIENCTKGVDRPTAKLAEEDVRYIRRNARKNGGGSTNRELAKKFGVGSTIISDIIHRKKWKHIE